MSAPSEIRTRVLALKGLRPGPLDDGGKLRDFTTAYSGGQEKILSIRLPVWVQLSLCDKAPRQCFPMLPAGWHAPQCG